MSPHSQNLPGQVAGEPPAVAGVRFGPALAGGLYLLLVGSAILALGAQQFPGVVPNGLAQVAPWLFLVFVLVFALYRLRLVQAKKYPAFKAFFQLGVALVFLVLLFARGPVERPGGDDLVSLMSAPSFQVRRVAAELAGYRPGAERYGKELVRLLSDRDLRVRVAAHGSLVRIAGRDLGPPDSPEAVRAWEEAFP